MKNQKKFSGEELAAKILDEFARINEDTGEVMPYQVTIHTAVDEFGVDNAPGVKIHGGCEDPLFIPDFLGLTEDEIIGLANELAEDFFRQRR